MRDATRCAGRERCVPGTPPLRRLCAALSQQQHQREPAEGERRGAVRGAAGGGDVAEVAGALEAAADKGT